MEIQTIAKILIVLCGGFGFALFGIALYLGKKNKKYNQSIVLKQKNKKAPQIYFKIYKMVRKNKLTKGLVKKIRARLEIVHDYSEQQIRRTTVKIFIKMSVIMILLIGTFITITSNLLLVILFSVTVYFFAETTLDYFVDRLKNRLLKQQIEFNDRIRHKYYELKMVEEAIYESSQDVSKDNFEIGIQGIKMYDVLMAKDVEKEMMRYNEMAPNKYLKMLLAISFMTKEYGDTKLDDGASLFMKSLNYLNSEIRLEVIKRERINAVLKSLSFIVLLPLFFIEPARNWASNNFVPLQKFYQSKMGFVFQVVIIMIVILCFFLIRRIQRTGEKEERYYVKKPFEHILYDKWFCKWIDKIKPKKSTHKYFKIVALLKQSNSGHTIESFYTRKIIMGLVFLITSFILILSLKQMNKHNVLYEPTIPSGFLGGKLSQEEQKKSMEITNYDRQVINKVGHNTTIDKIIDYISKTEQIQNEDALNIQANRIYTKIELINNEYLKWWEVTICLILFLLGYKIPNIMVAIQRNLRKIDMEDEVSQFQTILLILMHIKRISVYEMLEWMELFSINFSEPIANAMNNYNSGVLEALEKLKEEAPYPPFTHIVDNLKLAEGDLSVKEAFDELESEKAYYQDLRKMTNEKIIYRKQWVGQIIGFLPLYGLIILYLMIPMIVNSISEMRKYFNELNLMG
ncbi:MAG: hypothetical protein ACLFMO_01680 [Eubacteriales bacterium]